VVRFVSWLRPRLLALFSPPAVPDDPAAMTDAQLRHAIFTVSSRLIDIVGQWLMNCFDGRPVNDERFKWAMPTTVHAHVQLGFASANDSACLTAKGLELAASAAALGPIRDVAETFARLSWLLEPADDRARLGRAYGLMEHAISQEVSLTDAMKRSANRLNRTPDPVWDRYASNAGRKQDRLAAIATEDGVGIEKLPATTDLFELYLHEEGGYPLFSTLSRAASHPGASRPFMFYANPAKGMAVDYDFQGMHAMRAYWLSRSLLLHIALCRLVASELSWPEGWAVVLDDLARRLEPLAAEADRRVMTPFNDVIKDFMRSAAE
jgi:hypothetical protein